MRLKLLIAALGLQAWATPAASTAILPPNFVDESVVGGLSEPVSMAFLPDGRLLMTERVTGNVQMLVNGHLRSGGPVVTVPDVLADDIERGLQGIAVDPRWPQYPYLYVCFTHVGTTMSLVRYTGHGSLSNPSAENLTFNSPFVIKGDFRQLAPMHHGLGLRFDRDGYLLMSTGDDGNVCSVQDPSFSEGKLFRLDVTRLPAGAGGPPPVALLIPPGNPFSGPDSAAMLVYAVGLRNPWRFHVDPATGAILLADVGNSAYEELNEVFAGNNFGYPFREGPMVLIQEGCEEPGGPGGSTYTAPIHAIAQGPPGGLNFSAIMTATIYRPILGAPANWPSIYWGDLFYGNFQYSLLRRLMRSGGGWAPAAAVPGQPTPDDWAMEIYFCTDWLEGSDGSLYWLKMWSDDGPTPATGEVRRIRYTGPPVDVTPEVLSARVLSAKPNPFRSRVELSWRRPTAGPVTIEIFDLTGRRVRSFRNQARGSEGREVWDGSDERGSQLPSGLYLARFAGEQGVEPIRLILLD